MAPKKWTVMIYMTGDGDLADNCVDDLREMKRVGSNENIDIIAQYASGTDDAGVHRYHLKPVTETRSLKEDIVSSRLAKDLDMGVSKTLKDFLSWGLMKYPAENRMLVLWGHGCGILDSYFASRGVFQLGVRARGLFNHPPPDKPTAKAINWDDKTADFLDNKELKTVLDEVTKEFGKIQILGLDACLMGMAEVGFQVGSAVEHMVASEALVPLYSWPYDQILATLTESSTKAAMEPKDLATLIVDSYVDSFLDYEDNPVTYSAMDLGEITSADMIKAISDLAVKLADGMKDPTIKPGIVLSRFEVQCFDDLGYIDFYDFCDLLSRYCPALEDECKAVKKQIDATVFRTKYLGDSMQRAYGLSVYVPLASFAEDYRDVEFAKATGWDKFAETFAAEAPRPDVRKSPRRPDWWSREDEWERPRRWPRHKLVETAGKKSRKATKKV